MAIVNTYEAKAKLSALVRRARNGEEIVIAQAGVPMVRLVPVQAEVSRSRLGLDRAAFTVPEDFNDTLLDEY
jgi:prevent-host-death family protein